MRACWTILGLIGMMAAGCSSTAVRTDDAGARDGGPVDAAAADLDALVEDAGVDAAAADAAVVDAPRGDAVTCSCRSGQYHATATSAGQVVSTYFELTECGAPVCLVGPSLDALAARPCMMTADGVFRVYIDTSGFSQLVFSQTPCDAAWTGVYANEGGTVSITATRL